MVTSGVTQTVALSVVNWASEEEINQKNDFTTVKELVKYCLLVFGALVKKNIYGIAITIVAGILLKLLTMAWMQALTVTDTLRIRRFTMVGKIKSFMSFMRNIV